MNVVTLVGNLATDVGLKEVAEGKKVADFLLAVDRPGQESADFVRITVWERQAEICAEYLAKGQKVALEGRLRSRSWETEEGRRTAVDVVARRVEFLGRPTGGERAGEAEVIPFEAAAAG